MPQDRFDLVIANRRAETGESTPGPLLYAGLERSVGGTIQLLRWPKGKTTRAMNPEAGPPTAAEGRARLQAAHARYEAACRELASRGEPIRTPMFGAVPVAEFVRFMEQHMRHHWRQLPRGTAGA